MDSRLRGDDAEEGKTHANWQGSQSRFGSKRDRIFFHRWSNILFDSQGHGNILNYFRTIALALFYELYLSEYTSSLNEIYKDDNDGNNKKYMDKRTYCVTADNPK